MGKGENNEYFGNNCSLRLKVARCRQLMESQKAYNLRSRSFLDLEPRSLNIKIKIMVFTETSWLIKLKIYVKLIPSVESPWNQWKISMESVDKVHGINGHCPAGVLERKHWTISSESMENVHGDFPVCPWNFSSMSMELFHGIHGVFPRNPWTFSTVHGDCPGNQWTKSMDNVHGKVPWTMSMEKFHGQCPWKSSMDNVHGICPGTQWTKSMDIVH